MKFLGHDNEFDWLMDALEASERKFIRHGSAMIDNSLLVIPEHATNHSRITPESIKNLEENGLISIKRYGDATIGLS